MLLKRRTLLERHLQLTKQMKPPYTLYELSTGSHQQQKTGIREISEFLVELCLYDKLS